MLGRLLLLRVLVETLVWALLAAMATMHSPGLGLAGLSLSLAKLLRDLTSLLPKAGPSILDMVLVDDINPCPQGPFGSVEPQILKSESANVTSGNPNQTATWFFAPRRSFLLAFPENPYHWGGVVPWISVLEF